MKALRIAFLILLRAAVLLTAIALIGFLVGGALYLILA